MFFVSYSREFTHRVKSVSMAKFTSQEVEALQKGGNQVDKLLIYLNLAAHTYQRKKKEKKKAVGFAYCHAYQISSLFSVQENYI